MEVGPSRLQTTWACLKSTNDKSVCAPSICVVAFHHSQGLLMVIVPPGVIGMKPSLHDNIVHGFRVKPISPRQ